MFPFKQSLQNIEHCLSSIYRMTDLVRFLDPIVEKMDAGNVVWNITKEIVSVVIDVSNMASGSKWSSADSGYRHSNFQM